MIEEAQNLIDKAREAWGTPQGIKLAQHALEIDPGNVEALLLVATEAENEEEARSLLHRALASSEQSLGPNFEKAFRGVFWLAMETRPYMRTLSMLASLEEAAGNRKESIRIMERMLKLNPNDNQGVRYDLLGKLLAERMLIKTRKLLESYPDEGGATFAWGAVLYHFCMKDRPMATKLLKKARKQNPYVEEYLTGSQPFPESRPATYILGEDSEAIGVVQDLAEAWERRQHALLWLQCQLSGDPALVRYVTRMIDGR